MSSLEDEESPVEQYSEDDDEEEYHEEDDEDCNDSDEEADKKHYISITKGVLKINQPEDEGLKISINLGEGQTRATRSSNLTPQNIGKLKMRRKAQQEVDE